MNQIYKFKYCRRFFWSTHKVIGHRYDEKTDKICLYYPDGSLREISKFSGCELKLGVDWVLAVQKQMEREAGAQVPLEVG